ncbi:MAG: XdhC family protein [Gammaproteobacteria bacterium]
MTDLGRIWHWVSEKLEAQEPVALLIVVDSAGSSPGKIGAKMAVSKLDAIGTIGGGMVEAGLVSMAREAIAEQKAVPQIVRRAHHPSPNVPSSGMICGGEQTVLIYPCGQNDKFVLQQLCNAIRLRQPLVLRISARGLETKPSDANLRAATFSNGALWLYQETIGCYRRAYIIGGGHVGLALSKILDTLYFDITIIDERDSPETLSANQYARNKCRIPYANIARHVWEGEDAFVFIMTHSHKSDETVLAALAGKRFGYLGMLGSRHKIAHLKSALATRVASGCWQRLHAPMGLPIGSHTPEEIAVSIAAEVIQVVYSKALTFD